jgi:hypothetical protein
MVSKGGSGGHKKGKRHRGRSHSSSEIAGKRRNDQEHGKVCEPEHEENRETGIAQASPNTTLRVFDIGLGDVIILPDDEDQAVIAQATDHGDKAPKAQATEGGQADLIDRSLEFFRYLIDKATESKETQDLLLRAGRHLRRSLRLVLGFLAFCALVFGIGIGVAVSVTTGVKPLAALLVGLTGSATAGLIGGLAIRSWYVRTKRFLSQLTGQHGDPPGTNQPGG